MRHVAALLLLSLLVLAEDNRQIDWIGDWEAAFKQAKADDKPVMLCINSLDKEQANRRAATKTYRDPAFVKATRDFVMIVVSTELHANDGPCPRFGKITCLQHQNLYKDLKARHGDVFYAKGQKGGDMISPQHAWFRPDGTVFLRKEYELSQSELLERMRATLKEVHGKSETEPGDGQPGEEKLGEDKPGDAGGPQRLQPLTAAELTELERATKPGEEEAQRESRRAALGNLMATEKQTAYSALIEKLQSAPTEVRCDILRAFGESRVAGALPAIHEVIEKDREDVVRSFAAVALERIGNKESIPVLLKRVRKERDTRARKNAYRALGACGGGAKDEEAAKALLKAIRGDKQEVVRVSAALACAAYRGEAAPLVVKKLEDYAKK